MERIIKIKECSEEDGYEVVTTSQRIKLFISNFQLCCESWGYFWCNDDPQDFVGAELLDIRLTDEALSEVQMKANDDPQSWLYEGGIMFVNLETSKGVLQFVAYNAHNGYYGHTATVESLQLNHDEML